VPRKRTVAILSALGIGVATAIAVPMLGSASAATFDQVWVDDFNGPAGSKVDATKWTYDKGFGTIWGNNEYQTYTDSTNNVRQDGNGNLVITARKEADGTYTSGRLKTSGKFSQKFGRFEANIKIPRGPGLLPAFWAMGNTGGWPNNGEIDIMENVGNNPKTVYGTIHGPGYSGGDGTGRGGDTTISSELSASFHRYAIEWSPDLIVWTLDGKEYHRVTPKNIPAGTKWVFNDQPFYMLMNVAVGGDWPGAPVDSVLPEEMVIDYVKVYAYNANGTPTTPPVVTTPPTTTKPPVIPTTPPVTTPPTTSKPPVPPTTTKPPVTPTTPPATSKPPVVVDPPAGNAWAPYTAYTVGQVVTYNGARYQNRQAHTSLPGWEPANVLALWLPI
jgi:beta-glucanase (GH16 family)